MKAKMLFVSLLLCFSLVFSPALSGALASSEERFVPQAQSWQIQTVDSVGDFVGRWTSLALDQLDRPHITYTRGDGSWPVFYSNLQYARWTGSSWQVQVVQSTGSVGWGTSLVLDGSDTPHIGYNYYYYRSPTDQLSFLMYAKWTGSGWQTSVVNSGDSHLSLALGAGNTPNLAHSEYRKLSYSTWTGSAWQIQDVDTGGDGLGKENSLSLDRNGNPHISYYDEANGDLKYAYWTGSAWQVQTVDATGNVGRFTSLALDGSDNPHITYYDDTQDDLKYARWTGSSWQKQTIDSGGDVGQYTSLTLDGNSNPHVSYYDVTNGDLKYAKWTGSSWAIQVVDSSGNVGQYTSLKLDKNGNPHISYHDVTNRDLKYARWGEPATPTPTATLTPPPGVMDRFIYLPLVVKDYQPPVVATPTVVVPTAASTLTPTQVQTRTPTTTPVPSLTPTPIPVSTSTPTLVPTTPVLPCGIGNCDFEQGVAVWTEYSLKGYPLIMQDTDLPIPPRSGSWAAWLGGSNDETSYLQQSVLVPADRPYLAYWKWIDSVDACGYDFAYIRINGNTVDEYYLCQGTTNTDWELATVNLSAYAGQVVQLQVRVETDYSLESNLFVDDFAFQSTGN